MTAKCNGCNEAIDNYPAIDGVIGGDWYASCEICEWHSEAEVQPTIKQGLTLEELVAHKEGLNELSGILFDLRFNTPKETMDNMRELTDGEGNKIIIMCSIADTSKVDKLLEEMSDKLHSLKQVLLIYEGEE